MMRVNVFLSLVTQIAALIVVSANYGKWAGFLTALAIMVTVIQCANVSAIREQDEEGEEDGSEDGEEE